MPNPVRAVPPSCCASVERSGATVCLSLKVMLLGGRCGGEAWRGHGEGHGRAETGSLPGLCCSLCLWGSAVIEEHRGQINAIQVSFPKQRHGLSSAITESANHDDTM